MKPMLADNIRKFPGNTADLCVEQKFDGERLVIEVCDNEVTGYNRKGNITNVPVNIAASFDNKGFSGHNNSWVFDGEVMADKTYVVFDLLRVRGMDISGKPQRERRELLEIIAQRVDSPSIVVAPCVTGDKMQEFVEKCMENRAEGVMFKNTKAPYKFNKRTKYFMKLKFVKTIDVVVKEVNRKGKDQGVSVGLYDSRKADALKFGLVEVGGCKIPEHMVGSIEEGDVLELEYLYGTKANHIYQPIFLRIRTDEKDPFECTIDQLEITNKEIVS